MAFTHKVCGTTVTAICLMLPDGSANVWGALSCPKCESQVTIGECSGAYDDTVEMNAQPFSLMNHTGVPDATIGVGFAGKGFLCSDVTNGNLYINTGDKTTPVWKVIPFTP